MDQNSLQAKLNRIDGRGYPAYKDIRGEYRFPAFTLFVDHVQGDPFASPSRFRVFVPLRNAQFPQETFSNESRSVALRDFLARQFAREANKLSGRRGSGKSGMIAMDRPGQEILERSSVFVSGRGVEARFLVGLPAAGRRVLGRQAASMICRELPQLVQKALFYRSLQHDSLTRHINDSEDADTARSLLPEKGLCAFAADESILPRRSGIDERPLQGDNVVPFLSPPSLKVTLDLPHRGTVSGMGIPKGVTLIAGGGYHGKSTLLRALERGVYNHIPGDGRELVVTDPTACKIRAEDGRKITKVDISSFIGNLPDGTDTTSFSSENASGSTSQAANIVEAVQSGSKMILLDEDTCATNFMIRDRRMQELVAKSGEPITPFIDRVRQLFDTRGVSTVLVMGGSGDYFEVADTVILMEKYRAKDVTPEAQKIANAHNIHRRVETTGGMEPFRRRVPQPASVDPRKGRHEAKIKTRGLDTIVFGGTDINMGSVEQLVDQGQLSAIGQALFLAKKEFMPQNMDASEVACKIEDLLQRKGLDGLDSRKRGDLVRFRKQEFLAALNRLRTLQVKAEARSNRGRFSA